MRDEGRAVHLSVRQTTIRGLSVVVEVRRDCGGKSGARRARAGAKHRAETGVETAVERGESVDGREADA